MKIKETKNKKSKCNLDLISVFYSPIIYKAIKHTSDCMLYFCGDIIPPTWSRMIKYA